MTMKTVFKINPNKEGKITNIKRNNDVFEPHVSKVQNQYSLSFIATRDPNSVSVLQLPPKHCLVQYLKTSRADKSVKLEEKMAKLTIHSCSTPKRKNMLKLPINISWEIEKGRVYAKFSYHYHNICAAPAAEKFHHVVHKKTFSSFQKHIFEIW